MFLVGQYKHVVGDRRCNECWSNFPKKCVCQGFIHAQFIKEHWDGEKNLEFLCDSCGENYMFEYELARKRKKRGGK